MNAMSRAMSDTIGGKPFGKMCRRSTWRSLSPFAFAVVTKSSVITSMRELRMTREMPASVPTLNVRAGKMRWVDTLAMWAQSHAHCCGNEGPAPIHGGIRAHNHTDEDREDGRRPDEEQGPSEIVDEEVRHRRVPEVRVAPVEGDRVLQVDNELVERRFVESEQFGVRLRESDKLGVPRHQGQVRVSRHQPDQHVVEADDPEDRDDGVDRSPDDDPQDLAHRHSLVPGGPRASRLAVMEAAPVGAAAVPAAPPAPVLPVTASSDATTSRRRRGRWPR